MLAWERHINSGRDDAGSLYRRLSAPVHFAEGPPAHYGFGLGRSVEHGRATTGHGGALRGWRSHRLHVASERLSIVVMFNHLSDARAAALGLLDAALGEARPDPDPSRPAPTWLGSYIEPESGLSARIDDAGGGQLSLRFVRNPERLDLRADGGAGTGDGTRLRPAADGLWLERPDDNLRSRLVPIGPWEDKGGYAGLYRCAETGAELTVEDAGGALYGAFSGSLGRGRMELLDRVGADVLALPCPRALDHTPPGDWTLAFQRDGAGPAQVVEVGCWLARGLKYDRVG